jgi:hypothetical protein
LRRAAPRWRIAAIAGVFVISFALSVWGLEAASVATFYLLPTRAWELMMGALLALRVAPPLKSRAVAEILSFLGLCFIAGSVAFITPQTPFPGPAALVPCLGAALVIYAADPESTVAGRLLATRAPVFVGLISYSLYLWHWPVFVFATYVDFRAPSGLESAALIALSFGIAVLSWRYVERPFRRRRSGFRIRPAFAAAALLMGLTAASAVYAASADGFPQRLRPALRRILAEEDDHEPRIARCFFLTARDVHDHRLCRIGAKTGRPSFILWGDSHADAILPAVSRAAAHAGRTGIFAGGAACPPLLGVTTPMAGCRAFNDAVMALAHNSGIREVILESRWAKYAEGSPYGDEPKGHVALFDNACQTDNGGNNHAVFWRGLARTVDGLERSGKKVVLVASIPEIGFPVPAILARRALARDPGKVAPPVSEYLDRQRFVLTTFAGFEKRYGAEVLYPHRVLCASGSCEVARHGIPLYRDEHHLSVLGAHQLVPLMAEAF